MTLDESFYPTPRLAMQAPRESLAYVTLVNPAGRGYPDAVGVVDVDPRSRRYGTLIAQVDMPHAGDELHDLAWNAGSGSLAPAAARGLSRRYLVAPGLRSSRLHVIDTHPDPRQPRIVSVIAPERMSRVTGCQRPFRARTGPDGVYVSALATCGGDDAGGLLLLDPESLEVCGRWELERGSHRLAGDVTWHPAPDVLVTSEWGGSRFPEAGPALDPAENGRGHRLHVWDRVRRRHLGALDLGAGAQLAPVLCASHDPTAAYGFAAVTLDARDLSSSIWLWQMEGEGDWGVRKVIDLPAAPISPGRLPPVLRRHGVVPPLVTGLSLSLDDRWLYVACWGAGDVRCYDVSRPAAPVLRSSLALGGIAAERGSASQTATDEGGPRAIEVSRDGRRAYVTNGFHAGWVDRFYPGDASGWMVKLDLDPGGGMRLDPRFVLALDGWRPQQVRLEGGDASSDVYCYA